MTEQEAINYVWGQLDKISTKCRTAGTFYNRLEAEKALLKEINELPEDLRTAVMNSCRSDVT